jgi:hypothetical protein
MDLSSGWYYLRRDETISYFLLPGRDCDSLLVCAAVFSDSWTEFFAVFGRDLCDTDFEFFRGRFDCGVGDFSGVVVSGCEGATNRRMVGRAAFKFGGGIVAGAAAVFAEAA